jgi:carboxylesterase type B
MPFFNICIPVTNNKIKKSYMYMCIHGGSGQVGTGNIFDGTILAALGDITVEYIFGFFPTE